MSGREFEESIQTDLADRLDYAGYLDLERLLGAQRPLSNPEHHDEMLFIIQHQTSELWMKLVIHEVREAIRFIQSDQLEPCFKILARVKHIQRMLFEQWAVLETLTPSEYVQFRSVLGPASGFQSYQYRMIEFLFGNKDEQALRVFRHLPEVLDVLTQALHAPSLYDEFILHLGRRGYAIPQASSQRDFSQAYASNADLLPVLQQIYEHPHDHWNAYEMCEKLVDVEEQFSLWRYRHVLTVERIIGHKMGTGGSSGSSFLRKAVNIRLFPELWEVRTMIGAS